VGKLLRWTAYGLGGLLALLLVAAAAVFVLSESKLRKRYDAEAERLPPTPASAAGIAEAARMAKVHGCSSCHGEGLTGHVMDIPAFVARVVAPNIPEIAARASDQQLAAAIRQGIGHDGRALYIMPSPQYSRFTDAETAALIAWIRTLPRGGGVSGKMSPGPMGRLELAGGGFESSRDLVATYRQQVPLTLAGFEKGRHIAATGCAECHGPALYGQENAFGPAPDLRVAAGYDLDQFKTLLRHGVTPGGKPLGIMADVAKEGLTHLTDAEIAALHAYLQARAKKLGT